MKTGLKSIGMVVNVDGNLIFDKPWLETGYVFLFFSLEIRLLKNLTRDRVCFSFVSQHVAALVFSNTKCGLNYTVNRMQLLVQFPLAHVARVQQRL